MLTFANQPGVASPLPGPGFRPTVDLGAYTTFESSAHSSYNGLEASLERRAADGLAIRLAYTWSHAVDEVSDVFDLAGAFALAQDETGLDGGLRAERGDANFDVRHRFTAAWQYEIPLWRGRRLLGGWEIAGTAALQAGQPFTVNSSFDVNLDGNLTDRLATTNGLVLVDDGPVRIRLAPGVGPDQLRGRIDPDEPQFGSVGRNTFRAAGLADVDVALTKRFALGADRQVTARLEAFNVFNRPHFGMPVRILEAPGFGTSTHTTVPARTLQIVLRFAF
jgi:hypothetical protein